MKFKQILVAVITGTALAIGSVGISAGEDPATETMSEKIDDAVLTTKVKAALIESPDTKAHQINVETQAGVVRLIGAVDSATARAAATTVALTVKGVTNVQNELTVKSN